MKQLKNNSAKLVIIIVSWNTRALLQACLESVYQHPVDCDYDVWVVENASSDDSVAMVQAQFPQVHLIVNEENVGFAQANNQAVAASQSEYILLLNPDTVVKPAALTTLVAFMDGEARAAAAGSRLLHPDESLQPSCHPRPTLTREFWRMFYLDRLHPYGSYDMSSWDLQTAHDVDVIQGASFIMRRSVVNQIGFLDTTYFMYSEEVDLCYRMQQAGWRLYWVPASRVIHYGGQSTRQAAEKMFIELYRGKIMFFRKHYGRASAVFYKAVLIAAALPRIGAAILAKRLPIPKREALPPKLGSRYWRLLQEIARM